MIEEFVTNSVIQTAQDRMMTELAPYIIVGTIAFVMFIGCNACKKVDKHIEARKAKRR